MAKNILVTGSYGYIGSHVAYQLLRSGFNVISLDNYSRSQDFGAASQFLQSTAARHGTSLLHLNRLDIRDDKALGAVFQGFDVNGIIHCAGFKSVAESLEDPGSYFTNNVTGTLNLCWPARRHGIPFVFSSSASVYGALTPDPASPGFVEQAHALALQELPSPYAQSKLMCETIISEMLPTISLSLRYFNPVGSIEPLRDIAEANVMYALCNATGGKVFEIYGTDHPTRDGTCIRDYVHIRDLAEAHVVALKRMLNGWIPPSAINLGTENGTSVRELVTAFNKATNQQIPTVEATRRPGDPPVLIADCTLAKDLLNWKPKYSLEDACESAYAAWLMR